MMEVKTRAKRYIRMTAPMALLSALAFTLTSGVAVTPGKMAPLGTALPAGPVFLNGRAAGSASLTLNPGDRIETGARGGAVLTLSPTDGLVMGENSAVFLAPRESGIAAELERGRVLVSSSHERLRELRLAGEAISIRAAPGKARRYQVVRLAEATYVVARLGSVSIHDEGYANVTELPEGRAAAVRPEAEALFPPPAPQQPAAGGQRAGQISAVIPKDYIIRGPQKAQTEGKVGDAVQWDDRLKTEPRGRVRVALNDGSILNVGSSSELHVVQHNNQTQQTTLQMQYGRLRAQVVKMTQPGAQFTVRTNTAVCGVIGTDFYVEADERRTVVVVFKGIVRVTPLVAGVVAGAAVGAGQSTTAAGGAVASPAASTAAQVQGALTTTVASPTAAASVAATATATRTVVLATVPATVVTPVVAASPTFSPPPASPFQP